MGNFVLIVNSEQVELYFVYSNHAWLLCPWTIAGAPGRGLAVCESHKRFIVCADIFPSKRTVISHNLKMWDVRCYTTLNSYDCRNK